MNNRFAKVSTALGISLTLFTSALPVLAEEANPYGNEVSLEETIEPAWFFEKDYMVTADVLNIRSGPGTSYSQVGELYYGDIISVKSIDNGWAKFKRTGVWRYVSADYIEEV